MVVWLVALRLTIRAAIGRRYLGRPPSGPPDRLLQVGRVSTSRDPGDRWNGPVAAPWQPRTAASTVTSGRIRLLSLLRRQGVPPGEEARMNPHGVSRCL